jgi:hypothetical protein
VFVLARTRSFFVVTTLLGSRSEKDITRAITQLKHSYALLQKVSREPTNNNPNPISMATKCKNCDTEFISSVAEFKSEHDFNISGFNQIEEDCPNCRKFSTYDKSDYYLLKK